MLFKPTLIEGRFLRRYKRFFADVIVDGKAQVAHVPNTGSLKSCLQEDIPCAVSESTNPLRKLKFTLEMVKPSGHWIGVNTHRPNALAAEAFFQKSVPHWVNWDSIQKEVTVGNDARLDLVLSRAGHKRRHYIEVKNVSYVENGLALFPDAKSLRAQKHIQTLMTLIKEGHTAEMLFVIQRGDAEAFSPAFEIDPEYARRLMEGKKKGVKITPFLCSVSPQGVHLETTRELPLGLKF